MTKYYTDGTSFSVEKKGKVMTFFPKTGEVLKDDSPISLTYWKTKEINRQKFLAAFLRTREKQFKFSKG